MHKLLARQLRRAFGSETALPAELTPFLALVDATYAQGDVDREMLERSLDLSSQELSERSRRAEAKSMGLLRALPDFVLYLGASDEVLDVRAPWPEGLTCDAHEAIGRTVQDVMAPDGALGEWLGDALQVARATGTVHVVEFRDTWLDGAPRDLELRVSPLERGEALAVVRDISERKTAERALQESQERLELAILGSADGLWDWDPRTGRIIISPRFRELLGATVEELPDQIEVLDARLHSDDRARTWNAIGAHFQEQVPFDESCRMLHADGEYRWFQLRGQAIWDEIGEPTRMAGSMRDISDRKAKERELERARDAAEAASRAKDEFLANMSHEIRTPMNAVLGLTQLLLEGDLRPRERGYATSMLDAGRSLLSLINDILDIARIETGVLALDPMEFSLATTLRETFHLFEPKATAKGLAISMALDEQLPDRVIGDPGRLRQILMCLLDNAVKFTPQGAISFSVSVAPGDEVRLAVQDSGIGIPEDRRADILEKFTQVDGASTRRHGGTGLGLAISRHLAELMQGRIEVESTLGVGSRFTLCVPLPRVAAPPAAVAPLPPPAMSGVRVLVVNDDPDSSQRLQQDFEGLGMSVTSVATPAEALGALRTEARGGRPFGVCVVNDRSSDLQSEAMARVIKRDPLLRDTVLAILVTLGMPGDARRLFNVGFTAYLAPPLHPDDVRDAVASAWRLERVVGDRALVTRHSLAEHRVLLASPEGAAEREGAELAPSAPGAHEAPRVSHEAPRASTEGPLVLVVDDNDINRHVANEMLRRIGCRVLVADGGEAGVRLAAEHPFDLILMDVQMPVVDGFEAAARIRQQQGADARRVPIVAVTANAMRGDRQRCLDGGMDDYLAKPVTRAGLYELVQRWVPRAAVTTAPSRGAPEEKAAPTPTLLESALDVRQLRSIVGDDPARVAEFLTMFVTLTAPLVDAFVQAVSSGDATEVRRQAHKLKGSCGSAGAKELAALGARAERSAQDGDWGALRVSVDEFRNALERVKAAVTVTT
jgi:two-component system sensor histidine kinase/response regulator